MSWSEQERYAAHFTWKRPDKSVDTIWGSESPRRVAPIIVSEAEEETINTRFSLPQRRVIDASAVGILKSTLLPSLAMQSGLSIIAYSGSRLTNRVDGKDWLWPAGQVINAWTSAVGTKILCHHEDVWKALSDLSYAHKLILTGVTLWGGRLFYRVVSRSISRGHDEPRYEAAKAEPDFWNQSLFTIFLPEAVFQTLISLPFTLPFGATQQAYSPYPVPAFAELATGLGVFMFGAGFALEVLADAQLAEHHEKSKDLDTSGVWSIVRHPNYLGDALVHASFPLILYGAGSLHPLATLGPIANYILLRYIGGDKENEAYTEQRYFKDKSPKYSQLQEYKAKKNAFWPSLDELDNPWLWSVVTIGIACVMMERVVGRRQ
ncbi:hypothetical protein OIDMADRAFT_101845 [Oidiodendron maius Zn]|uniref:Steroid 5-alpha reductase C-terminal domain-containing protein n=1 Tax=Oidiodendron maius (strain Zn) TaxID=913774 RepID=A0A0C3D163_OIDMZ|nr:hypothetical protein OIDMADRAFT_101845 [Oidiodendron maius Zn]